MLARTLSTLRAGRLATLTSLVVPTRLFATRRERNSETKTPPAFQFQDQFEFTDPDPTPFRRIEGSEKYVHETTALGENFLHIEPEGITALTEEAMRDVLHLFRPSHLKFVRKIMDDPEASDNDRFVAGELLKNATVGAQMLYPTCQDTGTAILMGKKGHRVLTDGHDDKALSRAVHALYTGKNFRYSQLAPLSMFEEQNTRTNLPCQIDIQATHGDEYNFLMMAKGGGSANKFFLYQQTKAILREDALMKFLEEKLKTIGTAACPPYHLALVIGGLSADQTMKTTKLASAGYLDRLPRTGNALGRAFRDVELEERVHKLTQRTGIGAQFGGKYFCHDVRVIRLPRHGASLPVGLGVSCSADRQIKAKITNEGLFVEQLEEHPEQYLPDVSAVPDVMVEVDLTQSMDDILYTLSSHPVKTIFSLTGPVIVMRDIAHAKVMEAIENGAPMPQYMKDHPIYYAGPAKTPEGRASGSFGPTTASRMDPYIEPFQSMGGSLVTLAKGNRSHDVVKSCEHHGGFYLGALGGQGANVGANIIKKQEVLEYPELGMEAIFRIEVEDFPVVLMIDNKGTDFFRGLL